MADYMTKINLQSAITNSRHMMHVQRIITVVIVTDINERFIVLMSIALQKAYPEADVRTLA